MLPAFRPDDIIACKNVPLKNQFFQWNNIYVMDTSQGILVKRVKPGHDKKHILVVSEDKVMILLNCLVRISVPSH
jgi:hypothetical protein